LLIDEERGSGFEKTKGRFVGLAQNDKAGSIVPQNPDKDRVFHAHRKAKVNTIKKKQRGYFR
jgi:hypothetical protein